MSLVSLWRRGRAKVHARRRHLYWARNGGALDLADPRLRFGEYPVILECGASNGGDTLRFLAAFPTAVVHCFEPEPRAVAAWRAAVVDPRAHLHEVAVAATDGTTVFHRSSGQHPEAEHHLPEGWDRSGSIRKPTGHTERWPWVEFSDEMEVPTRSLDSWAAEYGIGEVDFIWADVQGAEGDLVRGGPQLLARTRYLYTEVSDEEYYDGQLSLRRLLKLLPDWEVVARYPDDVLLRNRRFG